jgi:poly(3-hydroxybutyrate) depolymerase
VLLAVVLAASACADDTTVVAPEPTVPDSPVLVAGDHEFELVHDGRTRSYIVHVPATAPAIVFMLHGGGSSSQVKEQVGLDAEATEQRIRRRVSGRHGRDASPHLERRPLLRPVRGRGC